MKTRYNAIFGAFAPSRNRRHGGRVLALALLCAGLTLLPSQAQAWSYYPNLMLDSVLSVWTAHGDTFLRTGSGFTLRHRGVLVGRLDSLGFWPSGSGSGSDTSALHHKSLGLNVTDTIAFVHGPNTTLITGDGVRGRYGTGYALLDTVQLGIIGTDTFWRTGRNGQILGGYGNKTKNPNTTVVGGVGNFAGSNGSFIGGGELCSAYAKSSPAQRGVIGGGYNNVLQDLGTYHSFIGGGYGNRCGEAYEVIGGGRENFVGSDGADASGICGGQWNYVYTTNFPGSVVGYGLGDTVTGDYGVAVGGNRLMVTGTNATACGGYGNWAKGFNSFSAGWLDTAGYDTMSYMDNANRLGVITTYNFAARDGYYLGTGPGAKSLLTIMAETTAAHTYPDSSAGEFTRDSIVARQGLRIGTTTIHGGGDSLIATTFKGALSGNATTADQADSADRAHVATYADSAGNSAQVGGKSLERLGIAMKDTSNAVVGRFRSSVPDTVRTYVVNYSRVFGVGSPALDSFLKLDSILVAESLSVQDIWCNLTFAGFQTASFALGSDGHTAGPLVQTNLLGDSTGPVGNQITLLSSPYAYASSDLNHSTLMRYPGASGNYLRAYQIKTADLGIHLNFSIAPPGVGSTFTIVGTVTVVLRKQRT
jgi:hypothetical protein